MGTAGKTSEAHGRRSIGKQPLFPSLRCQRIRIDLLNHPTDARPYFSSVIVPSFVSVDSVSDNSCTPSCSRYFFISMSFASDSFTALCLSLARRSGSCRYVPVPAALSSCQSHRRTRSDCRWYQRPGGRE